MGQHAVGQMAGKGQEMLTDDRPILGRAFVHVAEFGLAVLVHRRSP
jgi:hypothetical protein